MRTLPAKCLSCLRRQRPGSKCRNYTHYTEDDIREAARVLTGWTTVNWRQAEAFTPHPATGLPSGVVRVNPENGRATAHDNNPKTFSEAFGSTIITATAEPATAESVADEVEQLVTMIYAQKSATRYLIRRLYRFFVQ